MSVYIEMLIRGLQYDSKVLSELNYESLGYIDGAAVALRDLKERLRTAEEENKSLRQQLDAAQSELNKSAQAYIELSDAYVKVEYERDTSLAIIKKAQEQEPIYQTRHYDERGWHDTDSNNFKVCESLEHVQTRVVYLSPIPADHSEENDPAAAAIKYALEADEPMTFLRLWNEGEFDSLRENWGEIPDEVFIGADPLFKPEVKPS